MGWLLLAVLLYHHNVDGVQLKQWLQDSHPDCCSQQLHSIFKAVQRCKWRLFQERQKLDQSHKEVCAPVMDKCRYSLISLSSINRLAELRPEIVSGIHINY